MGSVSMTTLLMQVAFGLCTFLILTALALSILESSRGRANPMERSRTRKYVQRLWRRRARRMHHARQRFT
jgi:hypothetical protein